MKISWIGLPWNQIQLVQLVAKSIGAASFSNGQIFVQIQQKKQKKKTFMVGILVELLFTQNRSVREKCPYLEFLRSECLPQVTIVAFCNNIIQ